MKILTIVGARPQFIKAAPVSRAIAAYPSVAPDGSRLTQVLVHTGQHYDHTMSRIFFEELQIPEPDVNLGVGSGSHAQQTGTMLIRLADVLQQEKPDWVLVYGDTNSTMAGALAACKLHIPLAHVEAGLRSYNRTMPEEHNRVLTDHCADLLLCPSQTAVENLQREGIEQGVHLVGDTVYDAVVQFAGIARKRSTIVQDLHLKSKGYLLATVHRPYNTDSPDALREILSALLALDEPVVFPVHPRTRKKLEEADLVSRINASSSLVMIDAVGYLDILRLEEEARMILTDSGGMQKEAYFLGVPCITLRPETEWVETVDAGWNVLVGASKRAIVDAVTGFEPPDVRPPLYGDGTAAIACVRILTEVGARRVVS